MVLLQLQRKLYFSKDPEGVQHFPGGSNFFSVGGGGVQMLISIVTHITCEFPGGSGPPIPPLDAHMQNLDIEPLRILDIIMR